MIKKFKINNEIFSLGLLIVITILFTSYYNHTKSKILHNYKDIINNIFAATQSNR